MFGCFWRFCRFGRLKRFDLFGSLGRCERFGRLGRLRRSGRLWEVRAIEVRRGQEISREVREFRFKRFGDVS